MSEFKRGLIVDVNLNPTKGSETGKIRPCIIVTNNIYNSRVPILKVVPVTEWSIKKAQIRTNVEIEPSSLNGLTKKSIADFLFVFSLSLCSCNCLSGLLTFFSLNYNVFFTHIVFT